MTIESLSRFVTLVKHMSYTKAAEELYLSQSALSRQINDLERELGCQLFERNTRKIDLMPDGKRLYAFALSTLAGYAAFQRDVAAAKREATECLRVGYITPAHEQLLSAYLLERAKEDIAYEMIRNSPDTLCQLFLQGELDCALMHRIGTLDIADAVNIRKLRNCKIAAALPEISPLSKCETITLNELKNLPLILFNKKDMNSSYAYFIHMLQEQDVMPRIIFDQHGWQSCATMVLAHNGFSLCTDFDPPYSKLVNVIIDGVDSSALDLVFVTRKDLESQSAELFYYSLLDLLREK